MINNAITITSYASVMMSCMTSYASVMMSCITSYASVMMSFNKGMTSHTFDDDVRDKSGVATCELFCVANEP